MISDRPNRARFGALKNHRGLHIAVDHRYVRKKYLEFNTPMEHDTTRFVSLNLTKNQSKPGSPAMHFTLFRTKTKVGM